MTPQRHWPLLAASIVLLAGLLLVGRRYLAATAGHPVYPLDDTYIQLAIAKNLARQGLWGVTKYAFSGAGSSLLWPLLLALPYAVTGPHTIAAFGLNLIAAVALLAVADSMLRRHGVRPAHHFATLVLLIAATPLVPLVFIGMEHTLQCVAALAFAAGVARLCASPERPESGPALALLCLGGALVIAARYDTASLLVVGIALALATGRWRSAGAIVAGGIVPPAAYALVAVRHGWPVLPTSVLMKHRLHDIDPTTLRGAVDTIAGGAVMLVQTPALLGLTALALALVGWPAADAHGPRARESRWLLVLFLGATVVHVQLGRLGWMYRYEAYLIALGIVANATALAQRAAARSSGWVERTARFALGALVLFPLVVRGERAVREAVFSADVVYRDVYQLGLFLREHPPRGSVMLAELGAPAYLSDARIYDVVGLANLDADVEDMTGAARLDRLRQLARLHGATVATFLVDPAEPVPPEWLYVGGWQRTLPTVETRGFWSINPADAASLAADLATFDSQLPPEIVRVDN